MKGQKIFPSTFLGSLAGLIIRLTKDINKRKTNKIAYVQDLHKNVKTQKAAKHPERRKGVGVWGYKGEEGPFIGGRGDV